MTEIDLAFLQSCTHFVCGVHQREAAVQNWEFPAHTIRCFDAIALAVGQHFGCRFGFFNRRHGLTLDVFGECSGTHVFIVEVLDEHRNLSVFAEDGHEGTDTTFAGDQLVFAIADRPDKNRLVHTLRADRIFEARHLDRVKIDAGVQAFDNARDTQRPGLIGTVFHGFLSNDEKEPPLLGTVPRGLGWLEANEWTA